MHGHSTLSLSLSRFPRAQRGFTLVELSIVLVVIGLLIGGILVGQSLIASAKINAQVSQLQQFDAGVMAFKSQYNYLPGDAPAIGGNGDGAIGGYSSTFVHVYMGEMCEFWHDAIPSAFEKAPCGYGGADDPVPGVNLPFAKAGRKGAVVIASALASMSDNKSIDFANLANFYAILGHGHGGVTTPWQAGDSAIFMTGWGGEHVSAFTPEELASLDSKIDDGRGNTGYVHSGSVGNCCGGLGGIIDTPLSSCSDGSGNYLFDNKEYDCTPLIRIGGIVGDPQ